MGLCLGKFFLQSYRLHLFIRKIFEFLIPLKWKTLNIIAFLGRELQNLHMQVVHLVVPTPLTPIYWLIFIQQSLSGQFLPCVRLLYKHIPQFFSGILTLIGWNWQKWKWLFLIIELIFSKNLAVFLVSRSDKIISNVQRVMQKNISSLVLRFGGLVIR